MQLILVLLLVAHQNKVAQVIADTVLSDDIVNYNDLLIGSSATICVIAITGNYFRNIDGSFLIKKANGVPNVTLLFVQMYTPHDGSTTFTYCIYIKKTSG